MGIRAQRDHPDFNTIDLWCAGSRGPHTQRHTHTVCTHCSIFCFTPPDTHTHKHFLGGGINNYSVCLSLRLIPPMTDVTLCGSAKCVFGNVLGIALWHRWMLWEWDHNMLRETVILLWSKWHAAAALKWLIGVFVCASGDCMCAWHSRMMIELVCLRVSQKQYLHTLINLWQSSVCRHPKTAIVKLL